MPVSVIDLNNVSFFYNSDPILKDVSLRVEERDFLAVIGPNGSGKTTLLKIILGILTPMQGSVRVLRRYTSEDRAIARQVLEKVGMWEYRDRPIGKLSGGQRQRVLIARALCSESKILLMDEPTASVDTQFQTQLYDLLKELNATITIVVVSHDVNILSGYINSVACLNQTLFYHDEGEITDEMLHSAYHCPVDLIAHGGVPHRVLRKHDHEDR